MDTTTVTYQVPDGYRLVAHLVPDTAQPATIDQLAARSKPRWPPGSACTDPTTTPPGC
jgi:hypothetical protein